MTIVRRDYLVQSGNYRQPTVMNPPLGQRAENARHAIWHFAELITIDVALGVNWSALDGRAHVGEWVTVQAYAVCQPRNDDGQHSGAFEGERTEAAIVVHIDNEDPRNMALMPTYPAAFQSGIFLGGVDAVTEHEQLRVPTIVNFRGQKWKPISTMQLNKASDETHPYLNGSYRSDCILWRDNQQEMQAGFGDGLTDL